MIYMVEVCTGETWHLDSVVSARGGEADLRLPWSFS